jgi:predicted phage terminase large subunit-like protein
MDIDKLKKFEKLPPDVKRQLALYMAKWKDKKKQASIKNDFMSFVKHVWPDFVEGKHHKQVADKFNQIAQGKTKRVIINMAPRHTKSEFASYLLPAWMVGRNPKLKIIQSTNTTELSVRFGRKAQALERTYEWYTSGPRQRLQPGGTIIIVMTRWNEKDLTGRLIKAQKEAKADQWELIEFPAIMPNDKPLWPEYWNIKDLEAVKASIPLSKWNAQYMQNPTGDEGALIKREWWQNWEKELPPLEHVIQSYDTAFMKKQTADYSAITTWGVFHPTEDSGPCLLLLDALKGRYEFPELRRIALDQYGYWNPETVIIESKASGLPLTYELRKAGIPVINFTPSRGNDKHTRVNSVSPLFESGKIYAPVDMEFAQEVIEECAAFPYGDHDDLVDSMTQAVMRFRQGGLIEHPEDYEDEPLQQTQKVYY